MLVLQIWNLIFISFLLFSLTSFLISIFLLNFSHSVVLNWVLYSWGSSNISFIFLFDWVSFMFISFVLFISGCVFFYSGEYMEGELNISRFIILLAGFVGSMALLIFSPNLISLLLGWDGLGLVSYCLVIYYQNYKSLNAGMLTVLSNRVGDVFILFTIVYLLNYGDWSLISWLGDSKYLVLAGFMIMLASLTKSAQIPFSAWLPAAMAAPTPVSSLVHSSTLVTAGVYLLIRLGWAYDFWFNDFLMVISALTMFMAGLGACFEFDLKKVIALSTLSQLGLMMFSLSLGLVKVALFHLMMHAIFKALLFMSAGCIIHGMAGWQDLRLMGNLSLSIPYISSCFVVSNLALSGMPFLAGFYSKDLILELSLMQELNFFIMFLLFFSTGLTVAYTFRLIYYVVSRDQVKGGSFYLSDGSGTMLNSCVGLGLFSVFFGALVSWLIFDSSEVFLPTFLKNLTLLVCILGVFLGYILPQSSFNKGLRSNYSLVIWFSGSMWFMPYLSTQYVLSSLLSKGSSFMQEGDMGWLEVYGGQGASHFISKLSFSLFTISLVNFKYFIFTLWGMVLLFLFI
uniref:NADH dehydrogenase subunit 5 n=1 Tax=Paralepas cf. quadrata TaxID=2977351 RepID=UPI0021CCE27D|nr:NADH dehydrogenase subunit 5 [Paralepas cf. quadrata]UWM12980.1 NADH dehydrogenase subunit 5 [Paralepas cf. quadrata]